MKNDNSKKLVKFTVWGLILVVLCYFFAEFGFDIGQDLYNSLN